MRNLETKERLTALGVILSMVPWIQVYSNILTHDKTYSLAERLGIPNYAAVGIMVSLWAWASVNATDGDITKYPSRAIVDATGWKAKKPEEFYKVLVDIRLIEKTDRGVFIRNWERYASMLMDMMESQKKKTNERVKRHREKTRNGECNNNSDSCNASCNVTDALSNGATEPNITKPYSDDGDAHTCEEIVTPLSLFVEFFGREPVPAEVKQCDGWLEAWGTDLVNGAFERACAANVKNASYVAGILRNCQARGVDNADDMRRAKSPKGKTEQNKSAKTAGSSIDMAALDAFINNQFTGDEEGE